MESDWDPTVKYEGCGQLKKASKQAKLNIEIRNGDKERKTTGADAEIDIEIQWNSKGFVIVS